MAEWRYIAQRAITGEFLDMDLPISRDEINWTLSGAGSLRGSVAPDVGSLRAPDGSLLLEEWGTLIYAEADGEIRWGGILISSSFDNEAWQIEAAGFATYPHGIAYTGHYTQPRVDPADVIRHLWQHVQSFPNAKLGVEVNGTKTPARIGTLASGSGDTAVKAEPYIMAYWEAKDVGQEIEALTKDAKIDFTETHFWDGDIVRHRIDLHYPRAGRRRTDLTFIQGDNITEVVTPTLDGDDYANEVIGLGAGEGHLVLRRTIAVQDGRLRRSAVYTAKDITLAPRLDDRIREDLARRRNLLEINSITVANHPNAVIGSWALGDDILVQATLPWLGEVSLWCRITSWSLTSEDRAVLTLARSDSFQYGVS